MSRTNRDPSIADDPTEPTARGGQFPETRWSLIAAARDADTAAQGRALAELCRVYWYPLYSFARSRGRSPEDAEDLTQDLFRKLLANDSFGEADRERGRLRTFLLTAFTRLMASDFRRRTAAKRAPEIAAVEIDADLAEQRFQNEAAAGLDPEQLYAKHWAQAVLREVEARLEGEFAGAGKAAFFAALKPMLAGESADGGYAQVAADHGMTEGAVKVAAFRLRQRFKIMLREEIAHTVDREEQIEDELRHLYQALAAG
ncbi:MAG: sigma factor [Verrucomicrobiales bacterium]